MKETHPDLPRPFGVLYAVDKPTYEDAMAEQIARVVSKKGKPSLDTILSGEKTWVIG